MPKTSLEMPRAGYASLIRVRVQDGAGARFFAVEFRIDGRVYAASAADLRAAIAGRRGAPLYRLVRRWGEQFTDAAGSADRSASGRALNLSVGEAGWFTVSCASLTAVLDNSASYASIAAIPEFGRGKGFFSAGPGQAVLGV